MNSSDRRKARRAAVSGQGGAIKPKPPQPRLTDQPLAPQPRPPHWRKFTKWGLSFLSTAFSVYLVLPSWTFSLPSASYNEHNPFKSVFTLTNSGNLPGGKISVECDQSADYRDGTHTGPLLSEPTQLGTLYRNESVTFQCPQVVVGIQEFPFAMTPEQVKQEYQDSKDYVNKNGRYPGEDMAFTFADLTFVLNYRPLFLPFTLKTRTRFLAKPDVSGKFVWEKVPLDKKIEKVRWLETPAPH